MRTIIIADAVMGLDNVLAVAGAAHGSYLLVVTGLIISVPIVVWGSTLVLKVVDRYPGVVYIGAAVLVWTAVKMMTSEPLVKPWLQAKPLAAWLSYLAIPLVLWLGFVKNHANLSRAFTRALLNSPSVARKVPPHPHLHLDLDLHLHPHPRRLPPTRSVSIFQPKESPPCLMFSFLWMVRPMRCVPCITPSTNTGVITN